jgi:rod shape determining protein RodA
MASSPARYSRSLDWVTVLIYAIMLGLGWLNVYAASYSCSAGRASPS